MCHQVVSDYPHSLGDVALVCLDVDFWVLRGLIRRGDTCEFFDLSCASLFVKSFRIPLLDSAERRVNKNLDEAQARFIVDLARDEAIDAVRRYERGEGNARRVCEEFRYLADSPNILVPRFLVKSQIFVQTKPNIVAVKAVSELVQMQKVLLESAGDGGLAART